MHRWWRRPALPVLVLFALSLPSLHVSANAQDGGVEIFLGNGVGNTPAQAENYLARCLANPDDPVACYLARNNDTDGGLESAVQGQLNPVAYVTCRGPSGVCLELASFDPFEATDGESDDRSEGNAATLPSVDITILFDLDRASVRTSEAGKVAQIAAALQHPEAADARFAVISHTDATGSEAYNCGLSQNRAVAVRHRLAALGVSTERLHVIAAGEHVLRSPGDGEAAENRRVGFARLGADDTEQVVRRLENLCSNT